ncbi:uncharacterized protein LOC126831741 [Patella vulgata]|uniref:uncharacterized protein LOC126831741 n=1 Tax=Patella vulgata TaxID=6465 RepID=UPI0024A93C26|nr:uncharacterized protein LOC126831741 [Patella vulgata]
MVLSCSAYGCHNRQYQERSEVSFYRFPANETRRQLWINNVKTAARDEKWSWNPTRYSRLCSAHFISGKKNDSPSSLDYVPSVFVCSSKSPVKSKKRKRDKLENMKEESPNQLEGLQNKSENRCSEMFVSDTCKLLCHGSVDNFKEVDIRVLLKSNKYEQLCITNGESEKTLNQNSDFISKYQMNAFETLSKEGSPDSIKAEISRESSQNGVESEENNKTNLELLQLQFSTSISDDVQIDQKLLHNKLNKKFCPDDQEQNLSLSSQVLKETNCNTKLRRLLTYADNDLEQEEDIPPSDLELQMCSSEQTNLDLPPSESELQISSSEQTNLDLPASNPELQASSSDHAKLDSVRSTGVQALHPNISNLLIQPYFHPDMDDDTEKNEILPDLSNLDLPLSHSELQISLAHETNLDSLNGTKVKDLNVHPNISSILIQPCFNHNTDDETEQNGTLPDLSNFPKYVYINDETGDGKKLVKLQIVGTDANTFLPDPQSQIQFDMDGASGSSLDAVKNTIDPSLCDFNKDGTLKTKCSDPYQTVNVSNSETLKEPQIIEIGSDTDSDTISCNSKDTCYDEKSIQEMADNTTESTCIFDIPSYTLNNRQNLALYRSVNKLRRKITNIKNKLYYG